MSERAHTLGILVTTAPDTSAFADFLSFAGSRLAAGQKVYAYLLFEAVQGIDISSLQSLRQSGLVLHACALAAAEREVPNSENAVFSGLPTLGELMLRCDEFHTFSPESAV